MPGARQDGDERRHESWDRRQPTRPRLGHPANRRHEAIALPGIVAYRNGSAIGLCPVAPRTNYPALGRLRVLAPVDAQPVWSITRLFVRRDERRRGL